MCCTDFGGVIFVVSQIPIVVKVNQTEVASLPIVLSMLKLPHTSYQVLYITELNKIKLFEKYNPMFDFQKQKNRWIEHLYIVLFLFYNFDFNFHFIHFV